METAYKAGANIAAKLIWENPPGYYRNGKEVQDAAWDWRCRYVATNSPNRKAP
jgi:hypothetical protein